MTPAEREAFVVKMASVKAASAALEGPSLAERIAALPPNLRREFYEHLSPIQATQLLYTWEFFRRPKQTPPAWDWDVWLILAGRSFGKSRTAAEFVRERVEDGSAKSIALVGPDFGDIRRYMLGGAKGKERNGSGLLDCFPPWHRPVFKETRGEVHFHTGAVAFLCSAEDKELRGANLDLVWGDEPIKWPNAPALIEKREGSGKASWGARRPRAQLTDHVNYRSLQPQRNRQPVESSSGQVNRWSRRAPFKYMHHAWSSSHSRVFWMAACAGPSRSHKTAHPDHRFRTIPITQNGASRSLISACRSDKTAIPIT